jgi:hypothetical protein
MARILAPLRRPDKKRSVLAEQQQPRTILSG